MTLLEHDPNTTAITRQILRQNLLVNRLLYFFYFAAFGIIVSYLNVYFHEIGLSGKQIGLINSLGPFMAMLGGPVWGMLSDRFGAARRLFIAAACGSILAALGLSNVHAYAWLLVFTGLYYFLFSPLMPLLDGITLKLLGDQKENYSRQRIWGSLGFICTTLASGLILERVGLRWLFYGFSFMLLPFVLAAFWLPAGHAGYRTGLRSGITALIRLPTWKLFSASLVVLGLTISGMNNFLGITVKAMGGSEGLIGAAWSLGALSELPVMLLGAALITRIGSLRMLAIAYFTYAIRWILYAAMPAPEWALGIALMNGITFGMLWIAGVAFANELAPPNLQATAQGLLAATLSFTTMLGAPLAGFLFDSVGPSTMFYIYAGLTLLALCLLWGAARVSTREGQS